VGLPTGDPPRPRAHSAPPRALIRPTRPRGQSYGQSDPQTPDYAPAKSKLWPIPPENSPLRACEVKVMVDPTGKLPLRAHEVKIMVKIRRKIDHNLHHHQPQLPPRAPRADTTAGGAPGADTTAGRAQGRDHCGADTTAGRAQGRDHRGADTTAGRAQGRDHRGADTTAGAAPTRRTGPLPRAGQAQAGAKTTTGRAAPSRFSTSASAWPCGPSTPVTPGWEEAGIACP